MKKNLQLITDNLQQKKEGQVMLLTVLILSTLFLSATAIAGLLMVFQLSQVTKVVESTSAIFAADAGIERGLFKVYRCNVPLNTAVPTDASGNPIWTDLPGFAALCGIEGNQTPAASTCSANCTPPAFENDGDYKLTIESTTGGAGVHDPTADPNSVTAIKSTGHSGKSARAFEEQFR
jgi:hypothetical protein